MPEHLRAMLVIVAAAAAVFACARPHACAAAMRAEDFARRRNLWFGVTLAAFLAHDYWVFVALATALLLYTLSHEPNKPALFLLLLFAVPALPADVSGFGIVNYFFSMNYVRLLTFAILLPAFLHLRRQPGVEPFGGPLADKIVLGYLGLTFALSVMVNSLTDTVRGALFYAFIDVFLPYYVFSRSIVTLARFRDTLAALALAAMVLGVVGCFELTKHWLLYSPLEGALGVHWGYGEYLARGDSLRALASTGQPIALGYVMAVAAGLYIFVCRSLPDWRARGAGFALLLAGLYASLSRGPWLGAAAILLVFFATGPLAAVRYAKLILGAGLVAVLLFVLPGGENLIELMPFVGSIDEGNVVYRQRLLDIAVPLILQHPLFGSFDAMSSPTMEALRQGQGIIDVVNTYIGIALNTGMVGVVLFAGFFLAVGARIYADMRTLHDRSGEHHLLGRALLATLVGILIIIFTASSITVIPVVYWAVAGLGVGYARMLAHAPEARVPQPIVFRPWFAQ
jgi:O-antigen ligase